MRCFVPFIIAVSMFLTAPVRADDAANIWAFGADPSGEVDSTAAIRAAIESTFITVPALGPQQTAGAVYFPPGAYRVSSINATNLNGLRLYGTQGTVVLYADQQTSSMPVIDLSGSVNSIAEGIIVSGQKLLSPEQPDVMPSTGWLIADTVEGGRSTRITLRNCGSLGFFLHAAIYMRGATDSIVEDGFFQQYNGGGHTLYVGGVNPFNTTSHATLAPPWTSQTTSDLLFHHVELHGNFLGGQSTHTVRVWDAQSIRFVAGLNDSTGGPGHVITNGLVRGLVFRDVLFYSEGGVPAATILENQANLYGLTIESSSISTNAATVGPVVSGPYAPFSSNLEGNY